MSKETLPPGWCWATLKDVGDFINGDRGKNYPSRDTFVESGIPFINAGHLTRDGYIDLSTMNYITEERFNLLGDGKILRNDVLYCLRGSLGKAAIARDLERGAIASSLLIIRPLKGSIAEFIYYFLVSPEGKALIRLHDNGSAQPNLAARSVAQYEIPLPPLNEQRRIVAKLEALLARSRGAKEALDRIPVLLDRFRQSVLAAAFRGDLTRDWREKNPDPEPASKLLERIRAERRRCWEKVELERMRAKGRLPMDERWKEKYEQPTCVEDENPDDLHPGWAWATVDEIAPERRIGLVRSAAQQRPVGGAPYIRMQHYDRFGRWQFSDLSTVATSPEELDEYELRPADVLFNTRNSYELVGKVAIWPKDRPGHVYNNNLMRLRFVTSVLPEWAGLQMIAPEFQGRLADLKSATTSVCAIYGRDLDRQPLRIVPLAEQRVITSRIEAAFEAIERLRASAVTAHTKQVSLEISLLAKAFRGELVQQDPNDESASLLLERIKTERERQAIADESKQRASRRKNRVA